MFASGVDRALAAHLAERVQQWFPPLGCEANFGVFGAPWWSELVAARTFMVRMVCGVTNKDQMFQQPR